jgi:hypothetical protein
MLKYILGLVSLITISAKKNISSKEVSLLPGLLLPGSLLSVSNNCVTFSVGSGTGCEWMCNYCSNQLGTNNYYFPSGICSYQSGGCVGNPIVGVSYTCCSQ